MSIVNEHISIPKEVATKDDLDFAYLRAKGVEYIESFAGNLWTDFNAHDPGITMLEVLSYAISDLGMRISMPIENLLASPELGKGLEGQFYKAAEVFPTAAVTVLDYRSLFIDIKGVKNCWLRSYDKTVHVDFRNDRLSYNKFAFTSVPETEKGSYTFNGLYKLLVDFDDLSEGDDLTDKKSIESAEEKIIDQIWKKYHANRNLCEDLITIEKVKTECISVCANIEVIPKADEEWVKAKILIEINRYLSTDIKRYSVKELLDRGYTTDEIFEGPLLDNGFVDPKELASAELRGEIRLSDIIQIVMNIEGVKLIKDISISQCEKKETNYKGTDLTEASTSSKSNAWLICLPEDCKPQLCNKSVMNFFKGVLPLNINNSRVSRFKKEIEEDEAIAAVVQDIDKRLPYPQSQYISPEDYTTIQNDFPDTYGIGNLGLVTRVTDKRRIQAKQLQGYLLFFDQVLASYFKQLSKVKELFALDTNLSKTYFTQVVPDIRNVGVLFDDYEGQHEETITNRLFEQLDNNVERRNKVLDHLLARFAERFSEYTFLMKGLFGSATEEIVLQNKEQFLKDYKEVSKEKAKAFNYYQQLNAKKKPINLWDTNNVSGFQKRVGRLLGVKDVNRRSLSSSFIDIYNYKNTNGEQVFRWRIKDQNKKIVLSSTDDYSTINAASEELHFAVFQLIQTSEKEVIAELAKNNFEEKVIGNLRIQKSPKSIKYPNGRFSFDVIDSKANPDTSDYVVAMRYKFIEDLDTFREMVLESIQFMKFTFSEEGIFLVEHMVLRPDVTQGNNEPFLPICTDKGKDACSIDPYSFRVSIVIPGYTYRFANPDFRNYMEEVLRQELPAHILPKICWVGYRDGNLENEKEEFSIKASKQRDKVITALKLQLEKIAINTYNSDLERLIAETEVALQIAQSELSTQNSIVSYLSTLAIENVGLGNENRLQLNQLTAERTSIEQELKVKEKQITNGKLTGFKKELELLRLRVTFMDRSTEKQRQISDFLSPLAVRKNDLKEFEIAYKTYLEAKTTETLKGQQQPKEALQNLIDAMKQLNTIYPQGRLLDCNDDSDALDGKIILGQTNIGTL